MSQKPQKPISSPSDHGTAGAEMPAHGQGTYATKPADPATVWADIHALRDPEKKDAALARLLAQYEGVIRWRIAAAGLPEVADAYQNFVKWALEKNPFSKAKETIGPFRKYLATLLSNWFKNQWRHHFRLTGPQNTEHVVIDENSIGIPPADDTVFDLQWAKELIHKVVQRYVALRAPGLTAKEALKQVLSYGNMEESKIFVTLLREEVKNTCLEGYVEDEIRHLMDILIAHGGEILQDE